MLAQYIDLAVEMARYEIVEDDGLSWGEVPGFRGVWAKHKTLPGCHRELRRMVGGMREQ